MDVLARCARCVTEAHIARARAHTFCIHWARRSSMEMLRLVRDHVDNYIEIDGTERNRHLSFGETVRAKAKLTNSNKLEVRFMVHINKCNSTFCHFVTCRSVESDTRGAKKSVVKSQRQHGFVWMFGLILTSRISLILLPPLPMTHPAKLWWINTRKSISPLFCGEKRAKKWVRRL